MYSRRGGRVQVNYLQFQELLNRVERLEAKFNNDNTSLETEELTKHDIKEMLDHRGISYTTKHTKDDLLALLNNEGNNNA